MNRDQSGTIFKHICNYSGLVIELVADDVQLLEVNFVNGKKIKSDESISDPIKKTVLFLNDYFQKKKSKIEIILNTEFSSSDLKVKQDKLYLDISGFTEKEILIYKELLKVQPGKTVSYSELARRAGIPGGARFAGNCMASNKFPIIIPCHRIIKRDGSTGNYTGGVEIKEFLLKHEA